MFKPVKNLKIYEQVIEQIQNMIIDGTLKKGDKLPTERALAEQLNISRTSVREALRALEVTGLIESRQGGGNFIRESFEDSLFQPLSMMFMLEESRPEEILELRRIIEVETAVLAAKRINAGQLSDIKCLVERMKTTDDDEESVVLDKEFHYNIARASGNFLVLSILNVISSLMNEFIKDARGMILSNEENRSRLNEQHEDIYKALESHDPAAASNAIRMHFELISKYLVR